MGSSSSVSALAALVDGIRRVNRAWLVVVGMALVTLLIALPLSFVLRDMIERHLGPSLEANAVASGANYAWWQEFTSQASGLGTTLTPSIAGFGAVLDNISGLLDNLPVASTVAGATAAWMLIWSFLSGGVLDRLARDRRTRAHGFFAACGVHFWRFLRIGLLGLVAYAVLFGWIHDWIFGALHPRLVRDLTVERTAFLYRVFGYAIFGALLLFINVIFDYARIRTVVEDRRSAVGAVAGGARFVWTHLGSVSSLFLLNALAFGILVAAYALLAPGAPATGARMWGALVLGQGFILARHYLKLVFYASQTSLFQQGLAHAPYTASPVVLWPDSPAVETISNAEPVRLP